MDEQNHGDVTPKTKRRQFSWRCLGTIFIVSIVISIVFKLIDPQCLNSEDTPDEIKNIWKWSNFIMNNYVFFLVFIPSLLFYLIYVYWYQIYNFFIKHKNNVAKAQTPSLPSSAPTETKFVVASSAVGTRVDPPESIARERQKFIDKLGNLSDFALAILYLALQNKKIKILSTYAKKEGKTGINIGFKDWAWFNSKDVAAAIDELSQKYIIIDSMNLLKFVGGRSEYRIFFNPFLKSEIETYIPNIEEICKKYFHL